MTKNDDTAARIQALLAEARADDSPLAVQFADRLLKQTEMVVQLAADQASRFQQVIAQQDLLLRDVLSLKLAVFDPRVARVHANLSTGRFGAGTAATSAPKTSSGGTGPATSGDDDDMVPLTADEHGEIIADLNSTARRNTGIDLP